MKTYFIELVFNNKWKKFADTIYLSGIVSAKNLDLAKEKFLNLK